MPERLDKFLASQNLGSRKEVSLLVRSGAVTVNGLIAADSARKIDPEAYSIAVNGREINYRKYLYLMMNKPAGVLSATEDRREKTVLDLLPPELRRRGLFPAGRLDKDTTGLLIITDDGEFAHRMLAPKSHIYKLYEARTLHPVTEEDVFAFRSGVTEGGKSFAPARLWTATRGDMEAAMVEIREGKFHQVKRMFQAVGNQVLSLKRLKIGGLWLDQALPAGAARLLEKAEILSIFDSKMHEKQLSDLDFIENP